MPLEDLDLEFEDEDEGKKKKKDAVEVDVDLDFLGPAGTQKKAAPKAEAAAPSQQTNVKNIAEARPQGASPQAARPVAAAPQNQPRAIGNAALKAEPMLSGDEDVASLKQQLQLKEAVMDYRVELLGDLLGDIKLLDHQVGQLLTRLAAKHPESKQELLMIKKLLADFTAKKRK